MSNKPILNKKKVKVNQRIYIEILSTTSRGSPIHDQNVLEFEKVYGFEKILNVTGFVNSKYKYIVRASSDEIIFQTYLNEFIIVKKPAMQKLFPKIHLGFWTDEELKLIKKFIKQKK